MKKREGKRNCEDDEEELEDGGDEGMVIEGGRVMMVMIEGS